MSPQKKLQVALKNISKLRQKITSRNVKKQAKKTKNTKKQKAQRKVKTNKIL